MKFSTQEEYGLRLLLRIAKSDSPNGLTIPEISELEGLSTANVGKILRMMRLAGYIESARGQTGGYKLKKPAYTGFYMDPFDELFSCDTSKVSGWHWFRQIQRNWSWHAQRWLYASYWAHNPDRIHRLSARG